MSIQMMMDDMKTLMEDYTHLVKLSEQNNELIIRTAKELKLMNDRIAVLEYNADPANEYDHGEQE